MIILDLCVQGCVRVMKISGSKSILMSHGLYYIYVFALLADKTRLMRVGQTVTLTFSVPPFINRSQALFCLISLENQSLILRSHSV